MFLSPQTEGPNPKQIQISKTEKQTGGPFAKDAIIAFINTLTNIFDFHWFQFSR